MKKKLQIVNLNFQKGLLGALFFLLLFSNSFAQNVCRPTSQSNSTGGFLCTSMSVTNPNDAFDTSMSTYASLTNAVGLACFAQETLTFNQTAKAGDQVVIYFGTGNSLLNLGSLSNATIQAKLSGTDVDDPVALNDGLLGLQLLPGNEIAEISYTLPGDANQIKIQVGGLLSLLVNLRVYDVRLDFVKPTVTNGLTQSVCSGNSLNLSAAPASGTTLAWYSSATSTTPLTTGNSFSTPNLTIDTTYYLGVTRAAGCEGSERVPVVINVSNPIAPVISTSGTAICSAGATEQTSLSVINPIPGTTYNWYNVASGGVALASGNTYSPTVPLGTTSFYVEAAIGSCLSPARTQVDVNSNPVPSAPTVLTQSVTIQSGQNATLNATTSEVGVTLNWYDVATGGTALATNTATYTTPVLTATKTYYVEAQSASGNCVSTARVPVTVTVQPSSLGGCLEANSQQTNQNGLCLFCSATNPNNSVDGSSATAAQLTVPIGLINGWIQQTLQFNNPGRAGDIVDVELELPGGLADVALSAVSLATYNGATYNNDRVLINDPLITLQLLSGNRFKASIVAGGVFDRVEIRLGGLATLLTTVDIFQATYRYKSPTISGNTTICSGQTTTLSANIGVGETINWYNTATGGTSLASTTTYTTTALTVPTTYYIEITRNGCVNSERFPVLISINNPVAPVIATTGTTICSGQTTTLNVQTPVLGTVYNWYDAASAGNLLSTGTSFTTPNLTANTIYYVEAGIGSCSSATRTQVTVIVSPLPAAPTPASSNVVIQSGQSVTLQVSSPDSNVTFDWYDVPNNGTALATGTNVFTTPALTANKTYYVTARGITSGCASSARTAINVIISNSVSTCLQANSQITSKGGLITGCLLCNSANEGNSVDGDSATAANLSVPLGIVGDYIQQMLTFSTAGQAGDIIDVELGIPAGIINVNALSYINLRSYNGITPNSDQTNIATLTNVQLLSATRLKASFVAAGPFTAVEVRLEGLVAALASLDIYEASFRFKDAVVTGASSPICNGQTATLAASSTVAGETFKWYDSASGGIELSALATYTTPALTASTTYYLEATRGGTCINSVRQPVTVTVSPFATAADVTITSPLEASCAGEIVLSPTSALAGAQFRYYTDQNKTQEIITGTTVVAQPGVTFSKNATTGALTINGLSAAGTPYNYYISVTNGVTCENEINTLKQVIVNFPTVSTLAVTSPLVGCGTVNLRDAITGFDTTGNTTYTFYDPSNNVLPANAAANINTSGVYSIQAQGNGVTCPSVILPVTVTINPLPSLVVTPSISVNIGSDVPLDATSDGTVAWFDPQGNAITGPPFTTGVLNTPGVYTYTVVASNTNCSRTGTVSINVIDPNNCQLLTERVYANGQSSGSIITGGVSNATNAIDGNTQTFSTITTGLGLLGVGTTWQNLTWPANIVKGTPVTIKLGSEYNGLAVGQNLSLIGTKNGVDIGTMQSVSAISSNLLSGDNTFEYTFVPANNSGPQDYDGIRIQSASLLNVTQNTKVFDAYYTKQVSTVVCTPGDIQDVFYGATDLGLPLGVLTSTVGVSDAFNVADNDITTFATMYSGLGIFAAADLTVAFKTPTIASDTLRIVVSGSSPILSLNELSGFSIQRYLGNVAVGAPIENTDSSLGLRILQGDTMAMILLSSEPEPYDRVRIRFGGTLAVLESLRVHTVERVANTKITGSDPDNKITVCPGTNVTLQIPPDACSTYVWYDSPTGGTVVANGATFMVPSTLGAGIYKYYVQPVRYGCEVLSRGEVTVEVKASSPENALTAITLNGAAITAICSPTGTVTLSTSLSGVPVLTNPIYYWYNFNGTSSQLIAGATTSQLIVNGLAPGTYTYFVGVSSDEFCETAEADRKQITFTILSPSGENDILVDDAAVCHNVPASLTPTASTLTNPVFYWYFDANKTQPITNGTISGVTYAISSTGVLTVTGLTLAVSPITYYVGVSSDTTCENIAGTLQTATIIINDPSTPTTSDNTQDFCLVNAPTVANIQVNESNVVWYSLPAGGTVIAPTATLTSGVYYGAVLDPITGCESSVRLQVTINVSDPGTPITTDNTQDFCLVNAPTVANIQVNQTNVVWYSLPTGGTAIAPTTALVNGIYYGAILDPVSGCESAVRLAVTITVTDPLTPTTADNTQDFCLVNASTVASIQVNEANVVWYSLPTGGTAIAPTTALANGIYYGAILDPVTGCESSVRLQVTINVSDPGTPTTSDNTQDFCLINTPTVANIQVNEANVVWYSLPTGGTAIAQATVLASGIYYGAILDPVTGCESSVRLQVTINVSDPGTPTTTDNTQDFCLINAPTVANIQVNQSNVIWYSLPAGGTAIAPTTALVNGIYYGAILDPVTGCESAVRLVVTITITDPLTPTTTDNTQDFCLANTPTVASIQVNEANVVWYSLPTGGTAIAPTTALVNGIYYGAILDPVTGCESSVRLQVTINVSDPGTPTTSDNTQDFCLINAPTVANIQVNEANVVWYNSLTSVTAIAPTTALTNGIYYGAIVDPVTSCQSAARLQVIVTVTNPATPTTTDNTQDFCISNTPTVANIQVNETNVVWYGTLTGVTPIAPTTALVNGIYYGAILNPMTGCESSTRLLVTVTINNPTATPTTNSATQDFCSINSPTVANIQVNESNVVWYSTPTGGTALPAATALATGLYYGAISSTIGCENAVRLVVAVNVNTPGVVTTTSTTQTFCLSKTPTIANIQVNEPNVVWYSTPTGGSPLAVNTPLTATTYYATLLSNTTNGCANATRLAITVGFENDALYQITSSDDTPCVFQGVTYSIANGKSNYVWSVTNGTITSGGGVADGSVTISWSDVGPGTVTVTYINTCDETTTKTLNVTVATCSDLTITNTVSNPTPNFGDEIVFTITVNNVGQGVIINTLVSELIPSGYELVSSSTTAGVYDPATQIWTIPTLNAGESETLEVRVIVLPNGDYLNVATIEISTPLDVDPTNNTASASVNPICLTVYNEFTPNSDGANDLFRIDCIESYPNNELKVFNRYGALVYSKRGYENDWDGTANVSGVINRGDMLPTGTYFYVIDIGDGKIKNGWLSIMR